MQGGSRPVNFYDIYEYGFHLHYGVWTSMAPLFGGMEGGIPLSAMFKLVLFGLPF